MVSAAFFIFNRLGRGDTRLFQNMLREYANHWAPDSSGAIEKIGREAFYRFAVRQKLSLSNCARRAFRPYKFVHRGVADLTIDRLDRVQHCKFERQPFVVITNYLARVSGIQ